MPSPSLLSRRRLPLASRRAWGDAFLAVERGGSSLPLRARAREILNALAEMGRVARVTPDLYLLADAIERIKALVSDIARPWADHRRGVSRPDWLQPEAAVPILEYLDSDPLHSSR